MKTWKILFVIGILTTLMLNSVIAYDGQTEFIKYFDAHPEIQEFIDSVDFRVQGNPSDLSEEELIMLEKQFLVNNPSYLQKELNNLVREVPASFKWIIRDSKVNIIMEDGYNLGIFFGDDEIIDLKGENIKDSDIQLYVSDEFFTALNNGEVKLSELLRDDVLELKGVGFFNKMKFGAAKIAFRSFSFW